MKYLISMLGLGLLLVFVTSLAESSLRSSLTGNDGNSTLEDDSRINGLQKNASCLILCNYCGCDGSFVGDDCICDCGIHGEEHVQCLEKLESSVERVDFEMIDDEADEAAIPMRFRRDTEEGGAGRKLNRKNKRKKVNRRGRGRRFLQMISSGSNKNME